MNKQRLFLLIGIVFFMGGCTMAPEYTQPKAPIPDQWPQGPAYKDAKALSGAPTVPELKWEDFFSDKRLQEIIETALDNNLDLRLAALNVERARAQIALVAEVARAYLTLAADRSNLKLSQSTLKTQQANYNFVKRRFELGLQNELELRQAQTRVDAARRDIPRFTQFAAQDQNALNLLAGSPVPVQLLPADLSSVAPFKELSPGLSSEILLNRPDIVAAEHRPEEDRGAS